MKGKFRVIIASFNHALFLKDAIRSVFSQSNCYLEILIVDDGSTDGSRELISTLVAEHGDLIRLLVHPGEVNRGIAETYWLAMTMASGEYLAFLEPDDHWGDNYLSNKLSIFQRLPEVNVVFSPCAVITEGTLGLEMSMRQWLLGLAIPRQQAIDCFPSMLRRNAIATFSAFCVRRSAVIEMPMPPSRTTHFVDWWMLLLLSSNGPFFLDPHSLVHWRQRPDSALRRRNFSLLKADLIGFFEYSASHFQLRAGSLTAGKRRAFQRHLITLPLMIDFYRTPSLARYLAFFRRNPRWAIEILASYLVNSRKHRQRVHEEPDYGVSP